MGVVLSVLAVKGNFPNSMRIQQFKKNAEKITIRI